MQDKFNQFLADVHTGKYNVNHTPDQVEVGDPTNFAQCMDLAFAWCDYVGVPHSAISHFYAYQIWTQPLDSTVQYFDFIPNTKMGIPQTGDIIIFGTGVGIAGHVCIKDATPGTTSTFTSYDQNWDTPHFNDGSGNPICRTVQHTYPLVLGWLRLKAPPVIPLPDVITNSSQKIDLTSLDGNTSLKENYGVEEIQTVKSKFVAKDAQIANDAQKISDLQNPVSQPIPPSPVEVPTVPPTTTPDASSDATAPSVDSITTPSGDSIFSRMWKAFISLFKSGN